jgi:hypothetical protein
VLESGTGTACKLSPARVSEKSHRSVYGSLATTRMRFIAVQLESMSGSNL